MLSIGEEDHKGNEVTRSAAPLLKSLSLNFIGNVEGRDIYGGNVDVIVCDGFIGNVALKVSEGLVEMVRHLLRESLEATISRQDRLRAFAKNALLRFQKARGLLGIRRRAAARACAASASSATAGRTPTPSRTRSAWRRNSPRPASTSGSKKTKLAAAHDRVLAKAVNTANPRTD